MSDLDLCSCEILDSFTDDAAAQALPRRPAQAAAPRARAQPEPDGGRARHLRLLSQPSRAQPAAGHRRHPAAAGRSLRRRREGASRRKAATAAARPSSPKSSPTRCSPTSGSAATSWSSWPTTRRRSPKAIARLYTALRELQRQPGRRRAAAPTRASLITPETWVRDYIQAQRNHYPELEEAAETLGGALSAPAVDRRAAAPAAQGRVGRRGPGRRARNARGRQPALRPAAAAC